MANKGDIIALTAVDSRLESTVRWCVRAMAVRSTRRHSTASRDTRRNILNTDGMTYYSMGIHIWDLTFTKDERSG